MNVEGILRARRAGIVTIRPDASPCERIEGLGPERITRS